MLQYVLRRIGHAVLVLWAAFTATFFLLYALPGDASLTRAGIGSDSSQVSPQQLAQIRSELGLDRPVLVQYFETLGNTLRGHLGRSLQSGTPVKKLFAESVPSTLELAGAALLLAIVLGFAWAVLTVYVRWEPARTALGTVPALGVSIPIFWTGLIALDWLSFRWRLFPAFGNSGFSSLVLPAVVLAIPSASVAAQLLTRSLETTLASPFIATVQAKGASRLRILLGHALRNSVLPVLTALGMTAGHLIGGSVVAEAVFTRSGVGDITVRAVDFQDSPVVLFTVVFAATVFVVVNLIVDLLYVVIDPRIQLTAAPRAGARLQRAAA